MSEYKTGKIVTEYTKDGEKPKGTIVTENPGGPKVTQYPTGRKVTETIDGWKVTEYPDNVTKEVEWGGTTVTVNHDRTGEVSWWEGGNIVFVLFDTTGSGIPKFYTTNSSVVVVWPDGTTVTVNKADRTVTTEKPTQGGK